MMENDFKTELKALIAKYLIDPNVDREGIYSILSDMAEAMEDEALGEVGRANRDRLINELAELFGNIRVF
jgi:hypothetical protein